MPECPLCETCGRTPHPGMSCFAAEPKHPADFGFPMSDAWRDYYRFRFGDGRRVSNPPVTAKHSPNASRPVAPITLVIRPPVKEDDRPLDLIKGPKKPWRPADGLATRG